MIFLQEATVGSDRNRGAAPVHRAQRLEPDDFARALNASQSTVSSWLTGAKKPRRFYQKQLWALMANPAGADTARERN